MTFLFYLVEEGQGEQVPRDRLGQGLGRWTGDQCSEKCPAYLELQETF